MAQVAIMLAALMAVGIALFHDRLLPAKYGYDSATIQEIAQGYDGLEYDVKFHRTGLIYRELGLGDAPTLVALLGLAAYAIVLAMALREWDMRQATVPQIIAVAAALPLGSVYLALYSKDVFVLVIVALALRRKATVPSEALLIGGMALYAYWIRDYWYVVLAVYIGCRLVLRRTHHVRWIFIVALLAMLIGAMALWWQGGMQLDAYRLAANVSRLDSVDAQSMIRPFLGGSGMLVGLLNTVLTFVTFFVPVPLLASGQAFYLVAAGYLVLLWALFVRSCAIALPLGALNGRLARLVCLALAFSVTQAMFEPDWGSYLRHLSPLLPAILAVVLWRPPAEVQEANLPGGDMPASVPVPRRTVAAVLARGVRRA